MRVRAVAAAAVVLLAIPLAATAAATSLRTELSASFRFQTEVLADGTRAGRFWRGDLVLRGHGDPTLSSSDLDELAAAVRAEGITRVTGWIGADESFFDTRRGAPGWKRNDGPSRLSAAKATGSFSFEAGTNGAAALWANSTRPLRRSTA